MLRRLLLVLIALVLATLLAGGWYAYNRGFTQKWRTFVVNEFRKRGVEISMRRLTLEPFRGFLAKEVKVYETRQRKRTLAVIDEVRLVINFANLFQGKPFVEALDLSDADLDLPVDSRKPDGTKVAIRHLSGQLLLPPQQIYLSRLQADFYGVRVTASGRLINPRGLRRAERDQIARIAERFVSEVRELKFTGAAPQVDVRFSGDLNSPENVFITGALWAEKIQRREYWLENIYLQGDFRAGQVSIKQLVASDYTGAMRASGRYELASQTGALQLHSDLDVRQLLQAIQPQPLLNELVFYKPPEIDLTLHVQMREVPRVRARAHVAFSRFAFKSILFDRFDADIAWEPSRWAARDIMLVHRSGEVTGDVMELPGSFLSRVESTANRRALEPLLAGTAGSWFQRFDFLKKDVPSALQPAGNRDAGRR